MFLEIQNVTNGVIYSDTLLRSVRLKSFNRQSRIFSWAKAPQVAVGSTFTSPKANGHFEAAGFSFSMATCFLVSKSIIAIN
jgi:hypothetical protein